MLEGTLRKLQLTQLDILRQIDCICRQNDLRYSLYSGTQLGAVRHQGFIPWDDDLDICMPRLDYYRFIKVWQEHPVTGYVLQNKENTPEFSQSFTKIRKDHTTFLSDIEPKCNYHKGIFVDVFPVDRIPNGAYRRKMFRLRVMLYQLFTREFVPQKAGWLTKNGCGIILMLVSGKIRNQCRITLEKNLTKYNNNIKLQMVMIETVDSAKLLYPPDIFEKTCELPFEDGEFMSFSKWDEALRIQYGDYMVLPPEEERIWKHHPIILDFEHNYEELENK